MYSSIDTLARNGAWARWCRDVAALLQVLLQDSGVAVKLKLLAGFFMIATEVEMIYDVELPSDLRQVLSIFRRFPRVHWPDALLTVCQLLRNSDGFAENSHSALTL